MKVLISDGIAPEGAEILRNAGIEITEQFFSPEDLIKEIPKYDGIIVRSATKVPKAVIDASNLKVIARGGVGVDNIDVAYANEKGIAVLNTPGASSISVAEMALAHIFALNRFINLSNTAMRVGEWPKKDYAKGKEVTGKTLGIVGLGAIGYELAKRAIGLGMNVIYNSLFENKTDLNIKFVDFDTLLTSSDIISLHIPFDKSKGATICENEFNKMKDGVIFINTSRGEVIDEIALLNALKSGKVGKAGLDVFMNEPITEAQAELINHKNVSVTPHIAASTEEAQLRVSTEIAQKVVDCLLNKN